MRLAILVSVGLGLMVGCGTDSMSQAPLGGPVAAADPAVRDAPPPRPCPPGARAADRQKCPYGASSCEVACPGSGQPIPWPIPAEYQHACSVHTCCICQFDSWQVSSLACETECDGL